MADAAGDEADQHLAGARLGQLDLLHGERLAELLEHRGPHLHRIAICPLPLIRS